MATDGNENIDHSSRVTRSTEPYRLPPDLVSGSEDVDTILKQIQASGEIDLELNFKMMDAHLLHSDRVIANAAALKQQNVDGLETIIELVKNSQ